MSRVYRTVAGDVLDAICKVQLGSEAHAPAVLDANPGLADLGPVYPAGILIALPDLRAPVARSTVRLWGRA